MKGNRIKMQKSVKKFLSVTLIASMLIPSTLNGYTAYAADLFSDQGMNELDEFTDKAGEEDGKSVDTVGMPEAIEIFSDKGLNATDESSDKKDTLQLQGDYVNEIKDMFIIENCHNGSMRIKSGKLEVSEKPKIEGSSKEYNFTYTYNRERSNFLTTRHHSEYIGNNKSCVFKSQVNALPESKIINNWGTDNLYTVFYVGTYEDEYYYKAAFQEVRNPVKIVYYDEKRIKEDWVWTNDALYTPPEKKGSEFLGWFTKSGDEGTLINSADEAIGFSDKSKNNRIELYAHWKDHEHSWKYFKNSNNVLEAYCSEENIKCDYYGQDGKTAENPVTLTLQLAGLNEEGCISYSGSAYGGAKINGKDNFASLTGKTVTGPTYEGRAGTDYKESSDAPQNVGKYTVKVAIGDSSNPKQYELTADFEITKASISPKISLDDIIYGQEIAPNVKVEGNLGNGKVTYQYKLSNSGTYVNIEETELAKLPVGQYSLKATIQATDNYEEVSAECNFNVIKADATNENSKVSIANWKYGDKENHPSIDNSLNPGNGKVTYSYHTAEPCTADNETSEANGATEIGGVPKNAGTYYVKAEISATTNYNSGTATGSFTISPRPVELKWSASEFTYDGKEHTVTATVKNALEGDKLNLQYSGDKGTDADNYTAMITNLGNGNYTLQNSQSETSHSWEIKKREVTVIPDDSEKHIGRLDPELTYKVEGLVEGEKLYGLKLEREPGEDARAYVISAKEDANVDRNYTVDVTKKGTFTIKDHEWVENDIIPATTWSEGMKVKTCKVTGCNYNKMGKYYTIPKSGVKKDKYEGTIDKYAQIYDPDIKGAVLNTSETSLLKELDIFTEDEADKIEQAYKDGKNIAEVWLKISLHTLTEADASFKAAVEKIAGSADTKYFDADLYKRMNGEKDGTAITETGKPISIRFKVPDKMVNKQPYTIRDYKIIRLHNGQIDVLDAFFNSSTNEVTFETDKLSIFALTYKDTYYSPSYPVTGLKVSPESITLTKKDEVAQLTAEVTPSYADNKKVTWKSSDEKVATVDENGKATAVGNGTATITATSVSGSYTATISVTVKIPVEIEKLTIEAEKNKLTQTGETTDLKVKIEPENADEQKLIWKSDNEMVASVDANGRVTAVGNGTATITVTTEDGKVTASVMITVEVPQKPVINKTTGFGRLKARSVKQTKTSVTLQWNRIKGADGYLIYGNLCNANGKEYKYKKLATITSGKTQTWTQKELKKGTFYKYVVKAYKLVDGKKVVTDVSTSVHAVTQGGAYGIAKSVSVTKIGNKKNTLEITLKKGQKAQITAKEVKKDNKIKHHRNLCYESSNTKVATVTSKGLIQAKGKGTCTIWVYAQNGVYKELTVTVK